MTEHPLRPELTGNLGKLGKYLQYRSLWEVFPGGKEREIILIFRVTILEVAVY